MSKFFLALALLSSGSILADRNLSGPTLPVSSRFVDFGGLVWKGSLKQYRVPQGQRLLLEQDTRITADRIRIEGDIVTQGYDLQFVSQELIWGPQGRILAFDESMPAPPRADVPDLPFPAKPPGRDVHVVCESDHPEIRGTFGQAGVAGYTGYAGLGASCSVDDPSCKPYSPRAVKPISIFSVQNFGYPPKISGIGQTGGRGGAGSSGQNGGDGARGFNAYANCLMQLGRQAVDLVSISTTISGQVGASYLSREVAKRLGNGKLACGSETAGPGGAAGRGGMGGKGGVGGSGGAPIPIKYSLGFFDPRHNLSSDKKFSTLENDEAWTEFLAGVVSDAGIPGDQGVPGEIGSPGSPGPGGRGASDNKSILIPWVEFRFPRLRFTQKRIGCEIEIFDGPQGVPISGSDFQAQRSRNFTTTNAGGGSTADCKQLTSPQGVSYMACVSGSKPPVSENPVKSRKLSELALRRSGIEIQAMNFHWVRLFDYLLHQTHLEIKDTKSPIDYCAPQESLQDLRAKVLKERSLFLKAGQDVDRNFSQQEIERLRHLWQVNFFDVLDKIENDYASHLTPTEVSNLNRTRNLARQLLDSSGERFPSVLAALTRVTYQDLVYQTGEISKTCQAYLEVMKAENLSPEERAFFTVPLCETKVWTLDGYPYVDLPLVQGLGTADTKSTLVSSQSLEENSAKIPFDSFCTPWNTNRKEVGTTDQDQVDAHFQISELRYFRTRPLTLENVRTTRPTPLKKSLDPRGRLEGFHLPLQRESYESLGLKIRHSAWLSLNYEPNSDFSYKQDRSAKEEGAGTSSR